MPISSDFSGGAWTRGQRPSAESSTRRSHRDIPLFLCAVFLPILPLSSLPSFALVFFCFTSWNSGLIPYPFEQLVCR